MSEFKVPSQIDDSGRGFWVFVPVLDIIESGSTFTNGNPGARVVAEVEHFPNVGTVKMQSTVHLKQSKAKAAKGAGADPAAVALAVLAILEKRGVPVSALVPGGVTQLPPGVSGSELTAGRAAVGAILTQSTAALPSGMAAPSIVPAAVAATVGPLPGTVAPGAELPAEGPATWGPTGTDAQTVGTLATIDTDDDDASADTGDDD